MNDSGKDAQAFDASDVPPDLYRYNQVLAISQSGETLDLMNWLEHSYGRLDAIVNQTSSQLSRRAHAIYPMAAGIEQSVASTKAFVCTVARLQQMNIPDWHEHGTATAQALRNLPFEQLEARAEHLQTAKSMFILASGPMYHVAQELALKFKEVAYIHAEAFVTGSLKHGPFALMTPYTPVIILDDGSEGLGSTVEEIEARGTPVTLLTCDPQRNGDSIHLPDCSPADKTILMAVAGYHIAYQTARKLGRPIDRPRNLAKSVTVK